MTATTTRHEEFDAWIGRTRTSEDEITAFPLNALAATLGRPPLGATTGTPVPPLWHWLYFLPILSPDETRHDGHAKGDDFMPPIPLSRRVWAGSRFDWRADNPLRVGDRATRLSRIDSITHKTGKSGELAFVKVVHEFRNAAGVCILNEHVSAFRGAAREPAAAAKPTLAPGESNVAPTSTARSAPAVSLLGADVR